MKNEKQIEVLKKAMIQEFLKSKNAMYKIKGIFLNNELDALKARIAVKDEREKSKFQSFEDFKDQNPIEFYNLIESIFNLEIKDNEDESTLIMTSNL